MALVKQSNRSNLLSVPEAADALNVSVATIRSWVWQRQIESVRIGRAVRIRQAAIDEVIARGTVPALESLSA